MRRDIKKQAALLVVMIFGHRKYTWNIVVSEHSQTDTVYLVLFLQFVDQKCRPSGILIK